MSESKLSQKFISNAKLLNGKKIWIKKIRDVIEVGVPDIYCVYEGIPIFFESKIINSISLINNEKFAAIQIEQLKERAEAGAISLGLLLLSDKDARYIFWNEIPENGQITKEQFLKAEKFEWHNVKSIKEKIQNL